MEATQKKGFFKGMAKSLSGVTKRISHHHQHQWQCGGSSSKVGPYPPSISIDSTWGGHNMSNCWPITPRVCNYSYNHPSSFHEKKNYVADHSASSMQKMSYASFNPPTFCDQNETWGHGDDNVDFKASSYISNVRERFKLDRVDSTGNNYQEML